MRENQRKKRLAYSIAEFAEQSSLSRSLIYEAIRLGELRSIKVRSRRLIMAADGEEWLRSFGVSSKFQAASKPTSDGDRAGQVDKSPRRTRRTRLGEATP
jgi:excisionase family DNA binding protein